MTDQELADKIVKRLNEINSVKKAEFHDIGDNVHKVLKWLKSSNIVDEEKYAYVPGQKIKQYKGLDDLLTPTIEPIKITITEYKKHWSDWFFRLATLFGIISTYYFGSTDKENERILHSLTDKNIQLLLRADSLTKEVRYRDSLLRTERTKLKTLLADSLENIKVQK